MKKNKIEDANIQLFNLLEGTEIHEINQETTSRTSRKGIKNESEDNTNSFKNVIIQTNEDRTIFFDFTQNILLNILYNLRTRKTKHSRRNLRSLKNGLLEAMESLAFNCQKSENINLKIKELNEKFLMNNNLSALNFDESNDFKNLNPKLKDLAMKIYQTAMKHCLDIIQHSEKDLDQNKKKEMIKKLNNYINGTIMKQLNNMNKNLYVKNYQYIPLWANTMKNEKPLKINNTLPESLMIDSKPGRKILSYHNITDTEIPIVQDNLPLIYSGCFIAGIIFSILFLWCKKWRNKKKINKL